MEWSGVEWSGVEWSGSEWRGEGIAGPFSAQFGRLHGSPVSGQSFNTTQF